MFCCRYSFSGVMRFSSSGLYMLMIRVGFWLFVVLTATAVTSGKGNVMIWKVEVSRIRLLMYIALHGLRLG